MLVALALAASAPLTAQSDLIIDWSRQFGETNTTQAPVPSALPLPGGDVIVAGPRFERALTRIDRAGGVVWQVDPPYPGSVFSALMVPDGAGGMVFIGTGADGPGHYAARYDGGGNQLWAFRILPSSTQVFAGISIYDAVSDGAGGIVGVGNEFVPGVGLMGAVIHIDSNGQEVARAAPFGTSLPELYAIDRAPTGEYAVATGVVIPSVDGSERRNEAALLNPDLTVRWRRDLGPVIGNRFSRSVGIGGAGGMYVGIGIASPFSSTGANNTPNRARVLRLDLAGGTTLWDEEVAQTEEVSSVRDFAPAPGGGVFICGFSKRDEGIPQTCSGLLQRFSGSGVGGPARRFGRAPGDGVQLRGLEPYGDGLLTFGLGISEEFVVPGEPARSGLVLVLRPEPGAGYCGPAAVNSTGLPASITAHGSGEVAAGDLVLRAQGLPGSAAALFIVGSEQGAPSTLGNGQGLLCLGGLLGRYTSQVGFARVDGVREIEIDLSSTPTPAGPVAISAGETWTFQCWYRDVNPASTSNVTDAVSVTFD